MLAGQAAVVHMVMLRPWKRRPVRRWRFNEEDVLRQEREDLAERRRR